MIRVIDEAALLVRVKAEARVLVLAPRRSGKTHFCDVWLRSVLEREETVFQERALYVSLTVHQARAMAERMAGLPVQCSPFVNVTTQTPRVVCLDEALFMHRDSVARLCQRDAERHCMAISTDTGTEESRQMIQLLTDSGFTVIEAPLL